MPSNARQSAGPDPEHLSRLAEGVAAWNRWRGSHPDVRPDLRGADLSNANLEGFDLRDAELQDVVLVGANLRSANLNGARIERTIFNDAQFGAADLRRVMGFSARFIGCDLRRCTFGGGGLFDALMWGTDLRGCDLRHCNFKGASFDDAQLDHADLRGDTLDETRWHRTSAVKARLDGATLQMATLAECTLTAMYASAVDFTGARLVRCDLRWADLRGAVLVAASLINLDLEEADISGSHVFGAAAWHLRTADAIQRDLIITPPEAPTVSCDDLETAQFVYLLLHNEKLRQVIDTVGRKAVLLLGRFTAERKVVLDALRDALRGQGLVPVLFDFGKPAGRDLTETVSTLAHLSRFVIADLTDPRSLPQELKAIVPALPSVPVQPVLHESQDAYAMFADFGGFASVLPPARYRDLPHLLEILPTEIIAPAEQRIAEIAARRAAFEARLGRS